MLTTFETKCAIKRGEQRGRMLSAIKYKKPDEWEEYLKPLPNYGGWMKEEEIYELQRMR